MSKLYKVNVQTILDGFLTGVGTYDAERLGKSVEFIESYCTEQKELPLEKKDVPPLFEIIDTDAKVDTVQQIVEQKVDSYISMTHEQLVDIAKQKGLDFKSNISNKELIALLTESDETEAIKEEVENIFGFKSVEEFDKLDANSKIEYLDNIFSLPENIEDGSEEEIQYIDALEEIVKSYSGLSLSKKVVEKVKEILDYCNG